MATPTAGTRQDDVRRHNRSALLRRLHVSGPCTRAALATELGLNRSTIKALVDDLASEGIVEERVPTLRSGAGRPSLLVLPQPLATAVLAVDLRVEQVSMALVGVGGQMLGRCSWSLREANRSPRDVCTKIIESAAQLREEMSVDVVAVGVSVPGVVRRSDGYVHEAPNLHWSDVALGDRLARQLRLPVHIGNDADLGALAEHLRGAASDAADVVYVTGDVGVGGGAISGGSSLGSRGGYVGEIGHMVVNPSGKACYCGCRGCWETEVGERALAVALGMPEDSSRGVIVAELARLADDPERLLSMLSGFAEWLAVGLCTIANMLCPQLIVLGNLYTALPDTLVAHVAAIVRQRSLVSRALGGIEIVTSSLGPDVTLLGAAELAFEPVLTSR
ncbi:MAG: ROK family protein [Nocardioidaceae bacterium]